MGSGVAVGLRVAYPELLQPGIEIKESEIFVEGDITLADRVRRRYGDIASQCCGHPASRRLSRS